MKCYVYDANARDVIQILPHQPQIHPVSYKLTPPCLGLSLLSIKGHRVAREERLIGQGKNRGEGKERHFFAFLFYFEEKKEILALLLKKRLF